MKIFNNTRQNEMYIKQQPLKIEASPKAPGKSHSYSITEL